MTPAAAAVGTYLGIVHWVPRVIEDDQAARLDQVDAHRPGLAADQEDLRKTRKAMTSYHCNPPRPLQSTRAGRRPPTSTFPRPQPAPSQPGRPCTDAPPSALSAHRRRPASTGVSGVRLLVEASDQGLSVRRFSGAVQAQVLRLPPPPQLRLRSRGDQTCARTGARREVRWHTSRQTTSRLEPARKCKVAAGRGLTANMASRPSKTAKLSLNITIFSPACDRSARETAGSPVIRAAQLPWDDGARSNGAVGREMEQARRMTPTPLTLSLPPAQPLQRAPPRPRQQAAAGAPPPRSAAPAPSRTHSSAEFPYPMQIRRRRLRAERG